MSILDDGTLVMFGGSNKFDMILQCCQVSYISVSNPVALTSNVQSLNRVLPCIFLSLYSV